LQRAPLCSKCRRREAKVFRRLTSDSLCPRCYERELEKRVKRILSDLGVEDPRARVAAAFHPAMPLESALLARVLARVEERFGSAAILLAPGELHGALEECASAVGVAVVRVEGTPSKVAGGLVQAWRVLRGFFAKKLAELGGGVLVLPACAELLSALELSSLLQGRAEGLGEAVEGFEHPSGVLVANGFYGVPCAEVVLVARFALGSSCPAELLEGGCEKEPHDLYALAALADAVAGRSYEVFYAQKKVSSEIGSLFGRCSFCGGYAKGKLCYWCSRYFAGEPAATSPTT